MLAAEESTSRNEVPRSFAVVTTALPYSASVTVTWLSLKATGVTSVTSFNVDVAGARSLKIVNVTAEPGIDCAVGITSAAWSNNSSERKAKYAMRSNAVWSTDSEAVVVSPAILFNPLG